MPQIVVCGDSYSTAETGPRVHFSQRLVDKYNLDVINLARAGMSTVGIAFQIEHAIKLQPEIIIFNRTFPDRTQLITGTVSCPPSLYDFCYPYSLHENYKSKHVGPPDAPIFSTVVHGLPQPDMPLSNEQLGAIKYWIKHQFDWNLQEKIDNWIIDYWVYQIQENNIKMIELSKDNFAKPIFDFKDATTSFHTDEATQEWLADIIYEKIQDIK